MSPRLDTALDRREAVSALVMMLAAVMGLGALPESVEATEEDVPAAYHLDEDGQPVPTHAWFLAFEAGVHGKDDNGAAAMLADAVRLHEHYGIDGVRSIMREMRQVQRAANQ